MQKQLQKNIYRDVYRKIYRNFCIKYCIFVQISYIFKILENNRRFIYMYEHNYIFIKFMKFIQFVSLKRKFTQNIRYT